MNGTKGRSGARGTGSTLLLALVSCIFFVGPAQAAQITGIADENLEQWSPTTWHAFEATGVKQVRHIVAWNVAEPGHASELEEAERWVKAAQAHGLQITISFNHGPVPSCDKHLDTCNYPEAPSALEYLNAVGRFRENPTFAGITSYTAWNEPNHHVETAHEHPVEFPNEDMNPGSYPSLAGEYWVNLNFVCHLAKYGPNCNVAGGDFLEGTSSSGLESYMKTYKKTLAESSVSPGSWAIHPYTAAETGSWGVIDAGFMPQAEGKPVWFTEVGGMVCKTGAEPGYTGAAHTLQSAEQFQNQSANNLLALINHEGLNGEGKPRVERTYYYSFSFAEGSGEACPVEHSGVKEYKWDSNLLGPSGNPRPAYYTLFPNAPKGSPSAVQDSEGRQFVFYRGVDGQIWEAYWNLQKWTFIPLGGSAAGNPVAALGANGTQYVFFRGTNGALWELYWNLTQWSLNQLGGSVAGDPTVAVDPENRQFVFYRGTDGQIWEVYWNLQKWTFNPLGGSAAGDPSVARAANNMQYVFFRGTNGALWELYWNLTQWNLNQLGGSITGDPAALVDAERRQFVFYPGAGSSLSEAYWNLQSWQLLSLGGAVGSQPTGALDPEDRQFVFYRGTDGQIWEAYWNLQKWTFNPLGGSAMGDPSMVRAANNMQYVFFRGTNGALWELYWNLTQWNLLQIG